MPLRAPSWPFADKKVSRCSPRPSPSWQWHQIRKNLLRLPESGRGAPCGRPSQGYLGVRIEMRLPCTRNRIPLDFLVQMCDNIAPMATQCQNALSFGAWHLLERVAKPGDLTADLPADWHSRSHFETPRHSYNSFRSWPLSPCVCAGRSGRAAQRQTPVTRLAARASSSDFALDLDRPSSGPRPYGPARTAAKHRQ